MWRQCPTHPKFMACTDGRVRNIKTGYTFEAADKYVNVDGTSAHRLVLATFRPGYHKIWMSWCDHVGGVRAGNQLSNLRWSNPTLNAINKRRAPVNIQMNTRGYPCVRVTVLKHVHSKTFRTRAEADACAAYVRPRLFDSLQVLFKFLAKGNAPTPYSEYWRASQHLYRTFPPNFWRRLVGLPPGITTKPRVRCFTVSPYRPDSVYGSRVSKRDRGDTNHDKVFEQIISACRFIINVCGGLQIIN